MSQSVGSSFGRLRPSGCILLIGVCVAIVSIFTAVGQEQSGNAAFDHSLGGYIEYAVKHNPDLRTRRANVEAARNEIRATVDIPDPVVSAGFPVRSFPSAGKIGVSQTIPWPGSIAAKHGEAGAAYEREVALLTTAEDMVVQQIRVAYAELFSVGKSIQYTRASLDLLEQMSTVLASDYAVGRYPQSALLKVQLEMAVLEDDIKKLESEGERIRDELGRLMNTRVDAPFPDSMPFLPVPDDIETAVDMAVLQNPEVRAAEFGVERAKNSLSVATNAFGPSLKLSAEYDPGADRDPLETAVPPDANGKSSWSVGAGVAVPLWAWSKSADRSAAASRLDKAKAELELEKTELTAEVRMLFHSYEDAVRRIKVLEESLIPTAKQTLGVVEEGYANARVSVLDFLDAQRMLLDLEVQRVEQIERRESLAGEIVICCLGYKYLSERTGNQ